MDSAAIRPTSRRKKSLSAAALASVTELLEGRVMLSASPKPGEQPAIFVQNNGQWDSAIRYALHTGTGNVFITDNGPVFQIIKNSNGKSMGEQFFATFDGSNTVTPVGVDKSITQTNYFVGPQSTWRTNVPGYNEVAYKGLYSGVDLYAWGKSNSLKYEFHVAPGADWQQVKVSYNGVQSLSIDSKGQLHIKTALGETVDAAPYVYQVINGKQVRVKASFKLLDNDTYSFDVQGKFDPNQELILDPFLGFSSYLGSTGTNATDEINGVVTHQDAINQPIYLYLTGTIPGISFPSIGGVVSPPSLINSFVPAGNTNTFITKFDDKGVLIWNTIVGGLRNTISHDIAIDVQGNPIVVGETNSSDFVTTIGALQQSPGTTGANTDGFILKLNSSGTVLYSTFLGGTGTDRLNSVDVDASNNVYVAGSTTSVGFIDPLFNPPNFPIGVAQTKQGNAGAADGLIGKFDLNAPLATKWMRYLGGPGNAATETLASIDVNQAGEIVVGGASPASTTVPDVVPGPATFTTLTAFQPTKAGNNLDGYVGRLSTDGDLVWGTFIGGAGDDDQVNGVAINDDTGEVVAVGQTQSSDFLTTGFSPFTFGTKRQGTQDAFLARFDSVGFATLSTYFGGVGNGDVAAAVQFNGDENLIISGSTNSSNFPFTFPNSVANIQVAGIAGNTDAFVLSLDTASNVNYGYAIGGTGADTVNGMTIDNLNGVVIVGQTASTDFNVGTDTTLLGTAALAQVPIFTTSYTTNSGGSDGFFARFVETPSAQPPLATSSNRASSLSFNSIRLTWEDNSPNESGFIIRRKTGASGTYSTIATVGPHIQTYTDATAAPGTTYYYVVYAFNAAGPSFAAIPGGGTTASASLSTPTSLTATGVAGDQIDLHWNDNNIAESGYEIYRSEGTTDLFDLIATTAANANSYSDVTGLTPNTDYVYRIRAVNDFRASGFSNDATATTLGGTFIVAPTNLQAAVLNASTVRLTWDDNSNNELGFSIERAVLGTNVFSQVGTTAANDTSFDDTTVVTGTAYLYRVRAFTGLANSGYSNVVTSDLTQALAKPVLVEAHASSSSTIQLTWHDKSISETGFIIERAIGAPNDFNVITTTAANVQSFTDTGLLQKTRYYYRIRATDGTRVSDYSSITTDVTPTQGFFPPAVPTVIRARALSISSILITWKDNSFDESSFSIERATSLDGPFVTVNSVAANQTSYTDTGLADGTVYYYRVVARNGALKSESSAVVKMRTLVAPRLVIRAIDDIGGEPNNGLTFTVRRKDSFAGDLLVKYAVGGSATNGKDYGTLSGTVLIPDGQATADIVVSVKDDNLSEGTETVVLTLVRDATYKVSPSLGTASGTIADNDAAPASARVSKVFSSKSLSTMSLLTETA